MVIELKGKSALITGGTRGIGLSCVKLFAEAGADVAFTYRKSDNESRALITKYSGDINIKGYQADFDNPVSVERTAEIILEDFKKIDILVNNAGIWEYGAADKMKIEEWERTLRINLTSTFAITKIILGRMKENKYGRILNIASTAGQRGEAFYSHYAASKGGMISFTKSLAAEFGQYNINTNCVAPGWVETDMVADVFADRSYKEKVSHDIPVRRIAAPEDIAGPVLFLASDYARHINGEILNVNGGSVLCG